MFGTILNVLLVVISIALIILCLLQNCKCFNWSKLKLVCTAKRTWCRFSDDKSYYWFSNCIFRYCNHSKNVINNRAKVLFLFWNREVNE